MCLIDLILQLWFNKHKRKRNPISKEAVAGEMTAGVSQVGIFLFNKGAYGCNHFLLLLHGRSLAGESYAVLRYHTVNFHN